ncbi:PEP-CTERM sorting domain-containing protein [Sulfurirhabdus autotrophica]|uniref:Putative secreted protein with PEP-CTERM sorting signal n=1 Tax=Sulfurirhabdus autotrophica TaxID=1706046 RepID=A0A4R3Y0I5_9PROT|nr:PEP-CTERM sorting domain-containing protein [Sulfurirhabdus autotrophica]TCV84138.1 putative secreted protein with PEP-CTERM sorting signal [Sulfurirhabdus autotrophica]
MRKNICFKITDIRIVLLAFCATLSTAASALPYYYTDWTTANPAAGTAHGVMTLPDSSTVTVDFSAVYANGSPGSFVGAYTASDWAGWSVFSSAYLSSQVSNIPFPDMLQLMGGQNQIYKVHLSAAIKDPIMAIVSLGANGTNTHYNFDSPFTILSQGNDYWGGCATCLTQSGNDLIGNEGSGTIQFNGTFSDFSWTVPTGEYWHGFTFGIRTTLALEPNPPSSNVPEPATLSLMGLGLAALVAKRKVMK